MTDRDPNQVIFDMLPLGRLELHISKAMVRRLRAYAERFNAAEQDAESHYDLSKVDEFQVLIGALLDGALEADEKAHGLVASFDGRMVEDTPERRERTRRFLDEQRKREPCDACDGTTTGRFCHAHDWHRP